MVYSNRLYSAKATFQSNKEPDDAGFYTTNKTASTIFCNTPSKCYRNKAPYLYNFEQLLFVVSDNIDFLYSLHFLI
jgi:hypothetical protein